MHINPVETDSVNLPYTIKYLKPFQSNHLLSQAMNAALDVPLHQKL